MLNWVLRFVEKRRKRKRINRIKKFVRSSEDVDELIRKLSEF